MFFFGIIISIVASILDGIYFLNAWAWFVVPLGVPAIGYAHALGLQILIGTLRTSSSGRKLKTGAEFFSYTIGLAIGDLLTFGLMALIHLFM